MKKSLIVFSSLFLLSCSPEKKENPAINPDNNKSAATIPDAASPPPEITSGEILKNVVTIKTVVSLPGVKSSVVVLLKKKIDKAELRSIGEYIKKDNPNSFERTFIEYTYEGQQPQPSGVPPWATTHFTPDLEVRILGMSLEDERRLFRDDEKPEGEIIGIWILEAPASSLLITLYRQNGQLKMESKSPVDLSRMSENVTKDDSSKLPVYNYKNNFGEYYKVNSIGDLELWDNDGLSRIMTKIQ